jgi:hypothetical protein
MKKYFNKNQKNQKDISALQYFKPVNIDNIDPQTNTPIPSIDDAEEVKDWLDLTGYY